MSGDLFLISNQSQKTRLDSCINIKEEKTLKVILKSLTF